MIGAFILTAVVAARFTVVETSIPDMQAALFVLGSGTKGNLGVIDMRDIAPSIARTLGLSFPAEGSPRF